jgi:hypothetical protein
MRSVRVCDDGTRIDSDRGKLNVVQKRVLEIDLDMKRSQTTCNLPIIGESNLFHDIHGIVPVRTERFVRIFVIVKDATGSSKIPAAVWRGPNRGPAAPSAAPA